jgi:ferredoxin-NADP reductase
MSILFKYIDDFLNGITMYRLMLYFLIVLCGLGVVLSFMGILPYNGVDLLFSALFLTVVCWLANMLFSWAWKVVPNTESVYISALILALIITPSSGIQQLFFLFWAGVLVVASKFIITFRHKHIFNPVAVGVAITAVTITQSASWWVGSSAMLPAVILGGFLIVRKIHRAELVLSFLGVAALSIGLLGVIRGTDLVLLFQRFLFDSSLFFFAFVMLTEPLTTPPTKTLQIFYGAVTGILFAPQVHLGSIYSTPELALLIGNIFSFMVSPKYRLMLTLIEKREIGKGIYDFMFRSDRRISFNPGQYLEWTLAVPHVDSRGNRRYFTIASSPTEDALHLGVKFYEKHSRFKDELLGLEPGDTITASQLAGNFTLSKDRSEKCIFIAGGIGVTPFRSILKDLVDRHDQRDIIHFYSNNIQPEIVYNDVFEAAQYSLGVRTVYTLTDPQQVPPNWPGETGYVNKEMIMKYAPDYQTRTFYLSGPHSMVVVFEKLLSEMGVPGHKIKVDYFPGFV